MRAARAVCHAVLWLLGLSLATGDEPHRNPVVAVLKLDATAGVPAEVAVALDGVLSSEIFKTGRFELVNRDRIDEVVKEFKFRSSGVCDSTKCYAELGGAMGADKLLTGSVSRLGGTYVLGLKLIDITLIKEEFVGSAECSCAVEALGEKFRMLIREMAGLPGEPVALTSDDLGFAWPAHGDSVGKDGAPLVKVPAGEFLMGSLESDDDAYDDESPRHRVHLDDYYVDKYEVTNGQYTVFLNALQKVGHARCHPAEPAGKSHTPLGFPDPDFAAPAQPIVGVDWFDAWAYCRWAGRRVPTEAEWEKAARGTDGRPYPWGSERPGAFPQGNFADRTAKRRLPFLSVVDGYDDHMRTTAPVGSFPRGASPYGAEDMAGNVAEWVQDWYDDEYYSRSPDRTPTGPARGEKRVIRGGSWFDDPEFLRSAMRLAEDPRSGDDFIGFRCVLGSE